MLFIVLFHNYLIHLLVHKYFFVIDQAVQVPLISAARKVNSASFMYLRENIRFMLSYKCCLVWNSNSGLHCWSITDAYLYSTSRWEHSVLHLLLDIVIEK